MNEWNALVDGGSTFWNIATTVVLLASLLVIIGAAVAFITTVLGVAPERVRRRGVADWLQQRRVTRARRRMADLQRELDKERRLHVIVRMGDRR
jgi:hypothetical protein